jgi:glutamate N-acetyltransferase/amino-acid N-acetyltransferase
MEMTRSPLAPESFPEMPAVAGVRLGAYAAGLRYKNRRDLLLVELAEGTNVGGVLTQSLTAGAPVVWCRDRLAAGTARGLLVNAGNANVFNGESGDRTVRTAAAAAAQRLGCSANDIFLASTGVIGEPLDADAIVASLDGAQDALTPADWPGAAEAITTTDTYTKGASAIARIGDVDVTIAGIAKGSGMIAPDMATMLSFIFTDAKIPASVLQKLVSHAADRSFNCITVDGDTSTSDTVLLFATGAGAAHPAIEAADDRALKDFRAKLQTVMSDLALQVVKDGEGAQKLITINVSGAASARAARKIGLAIGNSPLVKTAIAGEDANWGRIVMAVGKAGEKADRDRLSIDIGGQPLARQGRRVEDLDEAPVTLHMQGRDIIIDVDVGVGRGKSTVWTCDLTHGYIDINADYRS